MRCAFFESGESNCDADLNDETGSQALIIDADNIKVHRLKRKNKQPPENSLVHKAILTLNTDLHSIRDVHQLPWPPLPQCPHSHTIADASLQDFLWERND